MNTVIIEETEHGDIPCDVFQKLVDSRVLFLYDYITDEIATNIVATLLYLDHDDHKSKISIYLNSEGGDIESVFMIYDIMNIVKSPIEIFCIGSAFGEAALILAAGTKGMRYATKSSIICLTQLRHSYSQHSDMNGAEIMLQQAKRQNKKLLTALHSCTGRSTRDISYDTERDFYMKPAIAKKYGIIDAIIGEK